MADFLNTLSSAAGIGSDLVGIGSALFGGGGSEKRWSNHWNRVGMEMQYDFAKNGLQWRADDAAKAGISKYAALGAASPSASPSFAISSGKGSRGQDVARATGAALDRFARREQVGMEKEMAAAQLRNTKLQGDLLASQIAKMTQPGTPPASPSATELINPSERTSALRGDASVETGQPAPASKNFVNADGSISRWPSKEAKAAVEDSMYEWEHMYRNRMIPWLLDQWDKRPRRALYRNNKPVSRY